MENTGIRNQKLNRGRRIGFPVYATPGAETNVVSKDLLSVVYQDGNCDFFVAQRARNCLSRSGSSVHRLT
jgi:hypothetical protein